MRTYAELLALGYEGLDEEPEPLTLPIRGKHYTFPSIPADRTVLVDLALIEATNSVANDPALVEALMGGQWGQMAADGVTPAEWAHVFATLVLYYVRGPVPAEQFWMGGVEAFRAPTPGGRPTPDRSDIHGA